MPRGRHFSFSVRAGHQNQLKEYTKDGKIYIESDLNVPGVSYSLPSTEIAYGEVESQAWPVTPYSIVLQTHYPRQETCWLEVYCDGNYIWNKPLAGGKTFTIDGFTKDGVNRELLFSLPRFASGESDRVDRERLQSIGEIHVRCIEAIFSGYQQKQFDTVRDFSQKDNIKGSHEGFDQANKKDCSRIQGGNQGFTTTKSGRERFRFTKADEPSRRMLTRFKRGAIIEDLIVNYRMKHCLVEMGFMEDEGCSPTNSPPPRIDKVKERILSGSSDNETPEELKKLKAKIKEEIIVDEAMSKMKELNLQTINVFDPKKYIKEEVVSKVGSDGKEEKVILRQKTMVIPKKRIINIDDDIQLVEELDDSVIFLGDDECFVIDGPKEEIPYVEL